jgi:hypothetical protein
MNRFVIGAILAGIIGGVGALGVSADTTVHKTTVVMQAPPAGRLALGEKAPDLDVTDLKGDAVKLDDFAGKPLVLQFGSLTEPVFRLRVADTEKLAAKYGNKVAFVVVYRKESHPADGEHAIEANVKDGFAIAKPVNQAERVKLAESAVERLGIKKQKMLVDSWSDTTSLRYGGYPNMTFVIDGKGDLQAGFSWMDPAGVKGALEAVLAGKPVPAEFRGKVQSAGSPGVDPSSAMQDMGGYRGAALALVIDKMTLTDKQKQALYPALGNYLAAAKELREKFGAGKNAGQAEKKEADGGEKAIDPEELRKAVQGVREKAQKLKTVIKENLSDEDAKALLQTLSQGPAKRMFAD